MLKTFKVTNFSKLYMSCYTVVPNNCLIGFPGEKKNDLRTVLSTNCTEQIRTKIT